MLVPPAALPPGAPVRVVPGRVVPVPAGSVQRAPVLDDPAAVASAPSPAWPWRADVPAARFPAVPGVPAVPGPRGVPVPGVPVPGVPVHTDPVQAVSRRAGPVPGEPVPEAPGPPGPVPESPRARFTRRGNSGGAGGAAGLALSSRVPGISSRRCRPAGGATAAPTAGDSGLVLPRDRDLPARGRMYRRTRSISRSRISRTPSDRVPGCQGMTKQRERHLSLPAVTSYGCRTVTERLPLFTDEPALARAKLRACGWSVRYLRCSPCVSGCAGLGGRGGSPGPRAQRRRRPSVATQRAVGGMPPPMTECH